MITTADLASQTRRELAELAKNYGVVGWHSMRKEDLVAEITKIQRKLRRKAAAESKSGPAPQAASDAKPDTPPVEVASVKDATPALVRPKKRLVAPISPSTARAVELTEPKVSAKTARIRAEMKRRRDLIQKHRDLSTATLVGGAAVTDGSQRHRASVPHKDRVVLVVRDSYWLQAHWEITRSSVQRAQSAMAEKWHHATPTLRLFTIGSVSANRSETVARDIPIHGGVSNWYIDVQDPPSRFRVAIGYLAETGEFHTLCRSNVIETPVPGDCERLDEHWEDIAEDYERIYALSGGYENGSDDLKEMFESKLRRAMPYRSDNGATAGEPSLLRQSKLKLDVDVELIVFGKTDPSASVMVSGRPVKLQPDGGFTVRMEFPDKRQVLPISAETRDGMRQRTTVIAIERNTKVMETVDLKENV